MLTIHRQFHHLSNIAESLPAQIKRKESGPCSFIGVGRNSFKFIRGGSNTPTLASAWLGVGACLVRALSQRARSSHAPTVCYNASGLAPRFFTCLLVLLVTNFARSVEPTPSRSFESSVQSRVGFDSNPLGVGQPSTQILSDADTLLYAVGLNLGLTLTPLTATKSTLKLSYAGELTRFDRWSDENYSTHRFGFNGQYTRDFWKFSGEGSAIYIAGSSDTLAALTTFNANSIPLWRERRQQWQYRLKLQAQATCGLLFVRGTGTVIAYDYRTKVALGKVAFADRSDAQAALDLGWNQTAKSLWYAGARMGHQDQATIPLPYCEFDYTNNYYRFVAGWEGKPWANTTINFSSGPDFHHYTSAIDERVFTGGRNRTSLWFEGNFLTRLTSSLTLSGKAAQFDWLASTGKSAYVDALAEITAAWMLTPVWTASLTTKIHRCDYFPAARDDWESCYGAGATLKLSPKAVLTLDAFRQDAWSHISPVIGREFQRLYVSFGATLKL